jgi:hypothetical protein
VNGAPGALLIPHPFSFFTHDAEERDMKGTMIALAWAGVAFMVLAVWARGGELNPPAGPVAPTMTSLAQLSADIAALKSSMGAGGSPKQIVRGVINFTEGEGQKSQTFSPSVDPARSLVVLGDVVYVSTPISIGAGHTRNGSCLIELTSTSITVATDAYHSMARQVSYQIIEYP